MFKNSKILIFVAVTALLFGTAIYAADILMERSIDVLGNVKAQGFCIGSDCISSWSTLGVSGSGVANYIPRWTTSSSLGNSVIFQSGSFLGIGSTTPYYLMHLRIAGSTPITFLNIHISGTSTDQAGIIRFTNTTNNDATGNFSSYIAGIRTNVPSNGSQAIGFGTNTGGNAPIERMRIDAGGNVGIGVVSPGHKLEVAGDIGANAFYYRSDVFLKKNIKTIDNSLERVIQLQGVSFDWKDNNEKSLGLIAQEVESIFPEAVIEVNGIKSVDYGKLIAPMIEAIKEQQKQIIQLQAELNK